MRTPYFADCAGSRLGSLPCSPDHHADRLLVLDGDGADRVDRVQEPGLLD